MKLNIKKITISILFALTAWSINATAVGINIANFKAKMSGDHNVPTLNSPASGVLKAEVDPYGEYIYFKLSYKGFTTQIRQANIHFASKFLNGGANLFLCGGPKPACPELSGSVEGKLYANDILGPAAQGIQPGDIKSVIKAMKKGLTYANIHTEEYRAGEIRGQIIPIIKK